MRIYHVAHERREYIWVPDYHLGHALSPNNTFVYYGDKSHAEFVTHPRTNNYGMLQSDDVDFAKDDTVFRVVFLGDSFTEGMQVEEADRYVERLEQWFNQQDVFNGKKVQVINAGVRGYSPITHYLHYKNKIRQFKPDLVILQLFANDVFEDNASMARSVLDDKGLPVKLNEYFLAKYVDRQVKAGDIISVDSWIMKAHKFLKKHSKFYQYIFVTRERGHKKDPTHQAMKVEPQFAEGYQFYVVQNHNENVFGEPDFRGRGWKQTKYFISSLKDLVENDGAQFMMFYIPIEAQLDLETYGQNGRMFFGETKQGIYINERLKEFAEAENIRFLDLLGPFNARAKEKLYLNWDGHLTISGHRVLAEELADFMDKELF
ncbi:MAG: hypothetical protein KC684_02740 [Candidatus Omnitrophica bacterium]|nr:hypothetical protein [Candidatus Omnitrophota bacterium]